MTEPTLFLKPGREKSALRRHPWIFSGAVARAAGGASGGDTVTVRSSTDEFLARAAYNPRSQIAARIWSWDDSESIDGALFERRINRSIAARASLAETTNALRWVNAESDGLPGLIVDRYGEFAVCQFLTAGAEKWKREIAEVIAGQPGIAGVYERSDVDIRAKEGLKSQEGVLRGEPPPELVEVWENAPASEPIRKMLLPPGAGDSDRPSGLRPQERWRFAVDVLRGHKTGFYLDQRDNRRVVAGLARGKRTLNLFCYTGAFSVGAWWGGAQEVISIDSSAPSLALAARNLSLNELPTTGLAEADAFKALREYRDRGETFDLILLDPPKFAHSESQINKAARAYKDINWLALRLLNPGGHLVTFSCSGLVSEDLFQKILFGAALDANRDAQIVGRLSQAGDHPVLLSFPEAAYLKGFVCRVE